MNKIQFNNLIKLVGYPVRCGYEYPCNLIFWQANAFMLDIFRESKLIDDFAKIIHDDE